MLHSQRIVVASGLVLLAAILHVNLCQWVFQKQLRYATQGGVATYYNQTIWVWTHRADQAAPRNVGYSTDAYTGLITDSRIDRADALVFGVVLPIALLLFLAYLGLGWRREARVRRGLCATCGYDLRNPSQPGSRCPECGAGV